MDKSFNVKAFTNTIKGVWNTKKTMEINKLGKKNFIFHFFSTKDKQNISDNQPWHFDQFILVLMEVSGDEQPSSIDLAYTSF